MDKKIKKPTQAILTRDRKHNYQECKNYAQIKNLGVGKCKDGSPLCKYRVETSSYYSDFDNCYYACYVVVMLYGNSYQYKIPCNFLY